MTRGFTKRVAIAGTLVAFLMLARLDLRPAEALFVGVPTATSQTGKDILQRGSPPIPRGEILQAVMVELAQRGISWGATLNEDDLNIQAVGPALIGHGGLRVKSIRVDRLRNRVVFEIWAPQLRQYLPILATVPLQGSWIPSLARRQTAANAHEGSPTSGRKTPAERSMAAVLVKPGVAATLIMLRPNARITIFVRPLQPGVEGQSVLVRDLSSARVMKAEVVGQNLLQSSF